jgi:hypothetical protein
MGIIDWIIEEVGDLFTDNTAGSVADTAANNLDLMNNTSGMDFVDPLAQGQQIIDSDPVLKSVQDTMNNATEIFKQATGSDHIPSSIESTQNFIHNVSTASPEQLNQMEGMLAGMNASDEIYASVAQHQQNLLDSNAAHQAILDSNQTQVESEGLISKVNKLLGTNI